MKKRIILSLATAVLTLGLFAGTALAAGENPDPVGGYNDVLPLATGEEHDNAVLNANATGKNVGGQTNAVDDVIKSKGMINNKGEAATQRTHGEYQNNSNSCASCHQTHTAAAANLLFKDGVYTTCTACHDGTLGFYNVFGSGDKASTAGTFGGDTVNGNASMHAVEGTVKISAAPGGNKAGTGSWQGEFNCASCHSAHGSYSDRLLNYNPNGMGAVAPSAGGIKADKVAVVNFSTSTYDSVKKERTFPGNTSKYIAVRGTKANHAVVVPAATDTDDVIMIYERVGTTGSVYTKTTNPWLYGYGARGDSKGTPPTDHSYYARFFTVDPSTLTFDTDNRTATANAGVVIDYYDEDKGVVFDFGKGLAYSNATNGLLKDAKFAEISRAYVVKMDLVQNSDYAGLPLYTVNEAAFFAGNKADGTKASGLGVAMSQYCAACHTDYMAKSAAPSGTFETTSYRHSTNSDSYTCVRCHFAHGTERDIMKDAENKTITDLVAEGWNKTVAENYMVDKNPSSALKRFTNMSVCWGCHTSSHAEQLKNNSYFMSDTYEGPHGLTDSNVPAVSVDDVANVIVGLDNTMEFNTGSGYVKYDGTNAPDLAGDKTVRVRFAASGVNSNPAITLTFKAQ